MLDTSARLLNLLTLLQARRAAYVSRSVSTSAYPVKARVVLHAPREVLAERFSPLAAQLTALDAERCVLEAGGPSLHHIAVWLAFVGVDFDVEAPEELHDYLHDVHQRIGRALACKRKPK